MWSASGIHPKIAGPVTFRTGEDVLLLWVIAALWNWHIQQSEDKPSKTNHTFFDNQATSLPQIISVNVEGTNSSKSANWPWILLLLFSKCCQWLYHSSGSYWNACLSWCNQNRHMIVNFLAVFMILTSSLLDCVGDPNLCFFVCGWAFVALIRFLLALLVLLCSSCNCPWSLQDTCKSHYFPEFWISIESNGNSLCIGCPILRIEQSLLILTVYVSAMFVKFPLYASSDAFPQS